MSFLSRSPIFGHSYDSRQCRKKGSISVMQTKPANHACLILGHKRLWSVSTKSGVLLLAFSNFYLVFQILPRRVSEGLGSLHNCLWVETSDRCYRVSAHKQSRLPGSSIYLCDSYTISECLDLQGLFLPCFLYEHLGRGEEADLLGPKGYRPICRDVHGWVSKFYRRGLKNLGLIWAVRMPIL